MSSSSSDETNEEPLNDGEAKQPKPSVTLGECVVCGHAAHGLHFGVLACRACAAFYRRSVVSKRHYICRRNEKNCPINKTERHICRYCRFQKCKEVGMQDHNVQWSNKTEQIQRLQGEQMETDESRPSTSSPAVSSPAKSISTEGPRSEQRSLFCPSDSISEQQRFLCSLGLIKTSGNEDQPLLKDSGALKNRIEYIFANPPLFPVLGVKMTIMQRMLLGLQHLRRNQNPKPPIVLVVDGKTARSLWEWQMSAIAEWAMYLEEFCSLPIEEKMTVYQNNRGAFHRLERIQQTCTIYGIRSSTQLPDPLPYTICPHFSIDLVRSSFDFSEMTDYGEDAINSMLLPYRSRVFEEVGMPMVDLNLTDTELAFMLGQATWHVEGRNVSKETKAIANAARDRMSNELHDHYVHELRMTNYASRLQKIMGILNDIENIVYEKNKMLELAKIFDVIKLEHIGPMAS